jgi:hypothetical protein
MNDKPWMIGEPSGHFFPMMCTNIVTHKMNRLDGLSNLSVQVFQKSDEFSLPFACITLPVDLPGTGIEGGNEVERSSACVLMFVPIGQVVGLSW